MYETHPRGLGMPMATIADQLNKGLTTIHRWLHDLLDKKIIKEIRKPRTPVVDGDLVLLKEMEESRFEMVGTDYVWKVYKYPDPALCYFIGYYLGDGTMSRRKGKPHIVYLDGTDFDALRLLCEIAEKVADKYAGKVGTKFTNQRGEKVPREKAHFWRIYVTRGALARTIATEKERIKPRTLTTLLRPQFIGDFLAGFWDADGSIVLSTRTQIWLSQHEPKLRVLWKIHHALKRSGIPNSEPCLVQKGAVRVIRGEPANFKEDMYRISIYKEGMPRWTELIGEKMIRPTNVRKVKELQKRL